jgi:hypothetical protein
MRLRVWFPVAAAAVLAALVVWLARRPGPAPAPPDPFPLPQLSDSPYLTTRPEARHVGIAACKECHVTNHASYLHTAHSRALSVVEAKTEPPDGAFTHALTGRAYRVHRQDGQLRHEETLRSTDGEVLARLDLPIRYLVGSGHFSRTYLVENDGFLSESPLSYYGQKQAWGMSPGFDLPRHLGFERPVTAECLVCHAGQVEPKAGTSEGVVLLEQAIGCESCHGPGSLHAERHREGKHVRGEDDYTIVNPAKLSRPLLEAVCSACHLQGDVRIDVRGRRILDYRPGLPLSDFRVHYFFASAGEGMTVVGHVEQLRKSLCYQKSPEMTCLSCHDMHRG